MAAKKRPMKKRPRKHLTDKQAKFCKAYIANGGNGTEAYKAAYKSDKMTDAVIGVRAHEVLKVSNVSVKIQALRNKQDDRFLEDLDSKIMQELSAIAFVDSTLVTELKKGTPIHPMDLPDDVRHAISGYDIVDAYAKGGERITKYKPRFWDKPKSLEMLGKIRGMFEKDNEQKKPDVNVNIRQMY